ncbi:MAG: hypothetical protein DMG55_27420 [Acidobacteria bacterium]|nr:MAG: hypothetical protein DMG55_27420 [Acidobacteriota bacterium]
MIDVPLVRVALGPVFVQVALVVIDIELISMAIRTIVRQIFPVVSNVFLKVLLLRCRILALGIGTRLTSLCPKRKSLSCKPCS